MVYIPPSVATTHVHTHGQELYKLNEQRMALANQMGKLFNLIDKLEPDSSRFKGLQAQISQSSILDQSLELRSVLEQTQLTAWQTILAESLKEEKQNRQQQRRLEGFST